MSARERGEAACRDWLAGPDDEPGDSPFDHDDPDADEYEAGFWGEFDRALAEGRKAGVSA